MSGGHSFYCFWQLQEEGKVSGDWRLRRIEDWERNMGKYLFFSNPIKGICLHGLFKCVLDVLVVVHCPIRLIPHFGCAGPAGCQLNFPYVCFLYVKSFGPHLGGRRWRTERETCKRGAEWSFGSVPYNRTELWAIEIAGLSQLQWWLDKSLFIPRSMLLEKYCPTSAEEQALEGSALDIHRDGPSCSWLGHTAACLTCNFS